MRNNNTKPKPSLTTVRLSQRSVELLQDMEEFFHQLELEGCPATTVARFRKSTQIAVAQTLAESKKRDFLFRQIKQNIKRLRRSPLDFPDETRDALLNIEEYASQLPDKAEQQRVLGLVEECRGFLNGL